MKRFWMSFIVVIGAVALATTAFSQSVFIGPMLLALSLFAGVYGLVVLYQIRQKIVIAVFFAARARHSNTNDEFFKK